MYERKPQNSVKQLSFNLKILKNNKKNDIYHLVNLARNRWQKKKKICCWRGTYGFVGLLNIF